jgi:hypothetical protein
MVLTADKKYRNSVVTVLAEHGPAKEPGFIIDRSGLVLTFLSFPHIKPPFCGSIDCEFFCVTQHPKLPYI